jgi:hypothetical protein
VRWPVDVRVSDDALADPAEELLDDMDDIFPRAADLLEQRRFLLACASGDSALFVMPLPEQEAEHRSIRAQVIEDARQLLDRLAGRDDRHPLVWVERHRHVAIATLTRGFSREGPLLNISSWVTPRNQ